MFSTRNVVPQQYSKSRDFQVFLKLLELVLNAVRSDTMYFSSLVSPMQCKARMLPFLSNYVGYTYDYEETVQMNRVITKNWSVLKRNRGSETGIRMAIALALSQLEDLDTADIYQLFDVEFGSTKDEYGRFQTHMSIYIYHEAYLSKLYDLIEAVRPAGMMVSMIPAIPIYSAETVVLTDEFRALGYDYGTSKLLWIGDIPIYVENSWEILENGVSTGQFIVDNSFYDCYHNNLNMHVDANQRIINTDNNTFTGELIRAPHIYKEYVTVRKINDDGSQSNEVIFAGDLDQYESNGWVMEASHHIEPTSKYFDLEHSARVLNTCYEIRCGGAATGYFVSADKWTITDDTGSRVQFYLKDYNLDGVLVKKVFSLSDDRKFNWHIDPQTRYFVEDDDGEAVNRTLDNVPWDQYSYLSKKRFVMNTSPVGVMYTTQYYVNSHEDIQDIAGNIILSKKDRYKVSDSTHIGFSEVHNNSRPTTYDKTWIQARSYAYGDDKDYFNPNKLEDFNDYSSTSGFTDTRIKLLPSDIKVYSTSAHSGIQREFDGTTYAGEISVTSGSVIDENNPRKASIPITCLGKNIEECKDTTSNSYLELCVELRPDDNILSVFSEIYITFESSHVGKGKTVFLDWKAAKNAEQFYNFSELPSRIAISNVGCITPRVIRFSNENNDSDYITIAPKVYDGTCEVKSQLDPTVSYTGGDNE